MITIVLLVPEKYIQLLGTFPKNKMSESIPGYLPKLKYKYADFQLFHVTVVPLIKEILFIVTMYFFIMDKACQIQLHFKSWFLRTNVFFIFFPDSSDMFVDLIIFHTPQQKT